MGYWKAFLIVSSLLWLITPTMAQVSTGALVGTVTDPSGAVITEAEVTVTDLDTGYQRVVLTGDDGVYTAENLKPGSYQVAVTKSNFKEETVTGITLQVSQRARIDVPSSRHPR